jgi:hypothetical protein
MREAEQLEVWEGEGGALVPPVTAPGLSGTPTARSALSPQSARHSFHR